jgi:DNA-directed RNA polymerase specialized sigma24 family protein
VALLNQRWSLHDVDDVEALLARAVSRSRFAASLRADERDDLLAWLFEVAWKLSESFDPSRGSFSGLLYGAAQRRTIDWQRSCYRTRWQFAGRTYERPRPTLVPLDTGLDGALGSWPGDPADGGDLGLAGVLGSGDRQRARDLETLGIEQPRRAEG